MSATLDELREQQRAAQEEFARDVDGIVAELRAYAVLLEPTIGVVGRTEALFELRAVTGKAFERCLTRRT